MSILRTINKVIANNVGYFWLPCPVCGNDFGGHEWGDSDYSSIPEDDEGHSFVGICPNCEYTWETKGTLQI